MASISHNLPPRVEPLDTLLGVGLPFGNLLSDANTQQADDERGGLPAPSCFIKFQLNGSIWFSVSGLSLHVFPSSSCMKSLFDLFRVV